MNPRRRQLQQLMRLSPQLHAKVEKAANKAPKSPQPDLAEALVEAAHHLPADLLARFERFVARLNADKVTLPAKGERILFDGLGFRLSVRRSMHSGQEALSLVGRGRFGIVISRRLTYQGRDDTHLSGPKAMWKLDSQAVRRVAEFMERCNG